MLGFRKQHMNKIRQNPSSKGDCSLQPTRIAAVPDVDCTDTSGPETHTVMYHTLPTSCEPIPSCTL